jgi:superfamily II DNA or RNA helicase/very-short-patch-repair endonuclease
LQPGRIICPLRPCRPQTLHEPLRGSHFRLRGVNGYENLPPALCIRFIRLAAFQNPDFYKKQAMRLSTHNKPRIIACAEDFPRHIGLPRGCLEELRDFLRNLGIRLRIRDERFGGTALKVSFQGSLKPEQQIAAEAMLAHENGVLAATTAFGKTVIAAWLIAQRGVNTLVLVHRRQLLDQWMERLTSFLGLPPRSVGCIGAGRKGANGTLDVAIMQSLVRKGVVDDRVADYGHLVVDECHHLSAFSFERLSRRAKAAFVTGLSATVTRKDGHHPIIFMQCGPVRHRVDARAQAAARPFTHHVIVRPTGFRDTPPADPDPRTDFQTLYTALAKNARRNDLICEDITRAALEGRSPVVLTERTEHLEALAELLSPKVKHLITLRGGMGRKDWRNAMTRLNGVPQNEPRVVLATGGFLGEGFDDSRLDTLFLTLPVSWRGTIAQYAGRLHRLHEGKREVRIYDYADFDVPVLSRMFNRRCRGYEAIGYTILLPAGAVPGWPREVDLPVDPLWKRTYSASIQRLIHDGVDVSLGQLFLESSIRPSPGADGAARARSASEAFLFRRLESMPVTEGKFRLNAELPIPFDDLGRMEVDFLCEEASLVLELDGAQHLSDAEAYRRDRRKDACLQEHGYFVLRFLADDLGEHLDRILDAILRALVHRRGFGR